jgi:hypothetical protein
LRYLTNAPFLKRKINRIKLAEARRRDAEKYGEEYVEVTETILNKPYFTQGRMRGD